MRKDVFTRWRKYIFDAIKIKRSRRKCKYGWHFEWHFRHGKRKQQTTDTVWFKTGVDEQLISEKTGHKSTAIRSYKRTKNEQQQRVSELIHGKGGNLSDGKGGNSSDGKGGNSRDGQCEKRWKCAIPVIPIAVHLVKLI